jgi:hypothetical protein
MEKRIENLIEETKDSPEQERRGGFEMSGDEAHNVAAELSLLHNLIDHDKSVTGADLKKVEENLKNMKMDVGGDMMTVEEAERIPDFKMNVEIWKEIEEGNFNNSGKLTYITPRVAESLSKHKGDLYLHRLTSLSDTAAESLSKHKGVLDLSGLTSLSDMAAESLSKYARVSVTSNLREKIDKFKK